MKKRNLALGIGLASLSAVSIIATSIVATSCSEKTVTVNKVVTHQLYDINTTENTFSLHGSEESQPLIKDETGLVYADSEKTDLNAYLPSSEVSISEITIPASVKIISNAFVDGTYKGALEGSSLTTINFENGSQLNSIEDRAFANITSLSSLVCLGAGDADGVNGLPTTVTSIGSEAFKATNLNLTLDLSNVTTINESAFENVIGTNFALTISDSLKTLGSSAFKGSSLTKLDLSKTSLTTLSSNLFSRSKVTSVTLPNTITNITNAFQNATSLTSINLPTSTTEIPPFAFEGCISLASVDLSALTKLITIGNYSFSGCTKLSSVKLPASVTTIGSFAFANNTTSCALDFTTLTNLVNVQMGAFYNSKITLPEYSASTRISLFAKSTTPCLDLSNTKIANYNPLAFAFDSSTPISVIKLPTANAISSISTSTPFTFTNISGTSVQIVGGKDVTASQVQTFAQLVSIANADLVGVSESSLNWTSASGQGYNDFATQAPDGSLSAQSLSLTTTNLTKSNLSKYGSIDDLQLVNSFTSFSENAFSSTNVKQITFGSLTDTNKGITTNTTESGTNESEQLAAIMNLFKSSSGDFDSTALEKTTVLQNWSESNGSKTKTVNGLTWVFNQENKTISCESVDQYVFTIGSGAQSFENNSSVKVVINLDGTTVDALKGNSTNI